MSKNKKIVSSVIENLALFILAVIWLIPILWLFVTAFNKDPGINIARFFPKEYTLKNFSTLLFHPDSIVKYNRWFLNTLVIAIFSCLISTIFILMVAYAFSCCRFKNRKRLMNLSMVVNMFPGVLAMVAIYFIMKAINLTESHLGMIIVYSAGSGTGFLIVKGFMDTIPASMREAAKIEGASELTIFTKVMMPLCKPIIVYQIISSFLVPWGDFVFAKLMLGHNSDNYTIAIGLYNMLDKTMLNKYFSIFCAGGLLVSIPISILFVIMQKYYVAGVTSGSTKG